MGQDAPRGIAIVGMACRFPGANDIDAFWQNLVQGVDCIRHFTDDELIAAGVSERLLARSDYVKAAPTIDAFDQFDAEFFEYSPREARLMDPQQRLLLEEAWRAMEDAGQLPGDSTRDVGVFMGSGGVVTSYLLAQPDLHRAATGSLEHLANDKDFVSTKLSYKLGLTGPSVNVQTACSTSMVAVHLACQSILDGECDMTLAGAATVRVPHVSGYLHRAGDIMSSDGRCRAYDANAEGTVFGSGAGIVVLKHVEDAIADGDRIYAVILGSAINNDGNEKLSYTASSTEGQARAMARAFAAADVLPSSIGMIEGHGTGTVVGDPLEVEALRRCFTTDAATRHCWLGSVKTNIGHLEQTAGVASLIKAALSLHHRKIPPSLNFETPNPRIDFDGGPFKVPTKAADWTKGPEPRRAAVNSLGLGGTNGFAILQEAPERPAEPDMQPPTLVLGLSARSPASLSVLSDAWRDRLVDCKPEEAAALCAASFERRAPGRFRRCIAADNADQLAEALLNRSGDDPATVRPGRKLAFLFPGQGAQYHGMAKTLLDTSDIFRDSFQTTATRLRERAALDIEVAIYGSDDPEALRQTNVLQPSLFAIELAMADLLEDFGVQPDAVLGHSVGAYAAAVVSGIYTRDDATDLIAKRAELMGALPEGGEMLALFAELDEAGTLCKDVDGADIAAINSQFSTVVSGTTAAMAEIETRAQSVGIGTVRLPVSHAFHSKLMQPVIGPLTAFARGVKVSAPTVPFVSDMTGSVLETAPAPDYLARHVRQPVRFADGLRSLAALGCTDFVEVGPGRALSGFVKTTLGESEIAVADTLDPKHADWHSMMRTVGGLWERGLAADPARVYPASVPHQDLPLYPFNRKRYWLERSQTTVEPDDDRLTGAEVPMPGDTRHFQAVYSIGNRPWLSDHRIHHWITLPVAAALLAIAEAVEAGDGTGLREVHDLTYHQPLLLTEDAARRLHLSLSPLQDGAEATLSSQPETSGDGWVEHITARTTQREVDIEPLLALDALRTRLSPVDVRGFYSAIDGIGLNYGPVFRAVRTLMQGKYEALAEISLDPDAQASGLNPHPAMFDACLHIFAAVARDHEVAPDTEGPLAPFLPVTITRFWSLPSLPPTVWSHCKMRDGEDPGTGRMTVDIRISDTNGTVVAMIEGLTLRRIRRDAFAPAGDVPVASWLYKVDWTPCPTLEDTPPENAGTWWIVGEPSGPAATLCDAFRANGRSARLVTATALHDEPPADLPTGGVVLATALSERPLMLLDQDAIATRTRAQFEDAKALLTRLADAEHPTEARVWIVTRGAQAPLEDDLGGEALQSVLWGHGRVLSLEHSNLWGGLIDLDHRTPIDAAANEILSGSAEDQIAIRDGRRFAPRLVRHETPASVAPLTEPIRSDASYLITGGLGVLGLKVADWLVTRQGAQHIWLVSRRAPSVEQSAAIGDLQAAGAKVHIASADIASDTDVSALVARIVETGPPLGGVFHCAGSLDDGVMLDMTWEQYHRVTAAKIEGTWALHQATKPLDLDHFVLFSSILSVIGSMGQLNYVAGNAFQDGIVAYRRRLGLPAVAMNWGPWEEAGLATDAGERGRSIWRARGTEYIPAETGLDAMELTLSAGFDHAVVTLTDWSRFVGQFPSDPPFYAELASHSGTARLDIDVDPATLLQNLTDADATQRHLLIVAVLGKICAANLELDAPPDPDLPLREAGLDSLMSITVINDIEQIFGVRLPARALLRGPSIGELANMLFEALPELAQSPTPASPRVPQPSPASGEPGKWLVTARPRPEAESRLFCFPFAGGGSAVFDRWGDAFDPSIEIVAVEPPGRLGRINEDPVRTVEAFVRALLPELTAQLDRPFSVLGHCLGGLTLYETLRFLQARKLPMPEHIFVSGARPPSVLRAPGDFERELEERLRQYGDYRAAHPIFEQSDEVFSEIVRAFRISDSDKMLEEDELRALILPTVRAEFEMSSRYIYLPESPFDIPITCFRGRRDTYFRAIDAKIWSTFTTRKFELFTRDTGHFAIVEDFDFIHARIQERIQDRQAALG